MRTSAIVALLIWATLWAQSNSHAPAKAAMKEPTPEQQLWCPVIEYAVAGAKSSEPPMRAYLLGMAALGTEKCNPIMMPPTLVDAFRSTLLIPETEDDFKKPPTSRDEAWMESLARSLAKRDLQQSVLAEVDESQTELLLDKAEPSVRRSVLSSLVNRAISEKKYDHAIELLSRMPLKLFRMPWQRSLCSACHRRVIPTNGRYSGWRWPLTTNDMFSLLGAMISQV